MRHTLRILLAVLLSAGGALFAASPPDAVNYQGVLRDAADNPLSGDHDMVFRYYDAETGGSEVLYEEHLAAGTGAVGVSGGLFNVTLGSGNLVDGAGAGTYAQLAEVFRDFTDVWLQIEVDTEVLSPRVKVAAAAYALNASNLGGMAASSFIDTSATAQVKAGNLQVSDLTVAGNDIAFGLGGALQSLANRLIVTAGADDDDDIDLRAGNSSDDGQILVYGQGSIELRAGNGQIDFMDAGGAARASFATSGEFDVNENLDLNGDLLLGGATLRGNAFIGSLELFGSADNHTLELQAGNSSDDGRIFIVGDGRIDLLAGNGLFEFWNGASSVQTATLDAAGDLQIDGDLTVDGGDLHFSGVPRLNTGNLYLRSGATDYGQFSLAQYNQFGDLESSLRLYADRAGIYFANTADPPGIYRNSLGGDMIIRGPAGGGNLRVQRGTNISNGGISFESTFGQAWLYSGDGWFRFRDGSNADFETANLDASGKLWLAGDLEVDGTTIDLSGARMTFGGGQTVLQGSTSDPAHDLILHAWDANQGGIEILGGGPMYLTAGNGSFEFRNNGTGAAATLNGSGDLHIEGDLDLGGQFISGPSGLNFVVRSTLASMHVESDGELRMVVDRDANGASDAEWFHHDPTVSSNKLMLLQEDGDLFIAGTLTENFSFDIAESFVASELLEPGDVVRLDPERAGAVRKSVGAGDALAIGVISETPGVLLGGAPFSPEALQQVWGDEILGEFEAARNVLRKTVLAARPDLRARLDAVLAAATPASDEDSAVVADPDPDDLREVENDIEWVMLQRFHAERFAPVALAGRVPVKAVGPVEAGDPLAPGPQPGRAMRADGSGPVIGTALEALAEGEGKVLAFVHLGSNAVVAPIEQAQAELAEELDARTPDPSTGTQTLAGNLQIVLDRDGEQDARFSIFRDGESDGELGDEVFRVDEAGNVFAKGAFRPASMDVAEFFAVGGPVEPGDVLAVDPEVPGRYRPASEAQAAAVVGVVASEPGVLLGGELSRIAAVDPELARELDLARQLGDSEAETRIWALLEARFLETHAAVALTGTVEVKVDAGFGAIAPGDLLVASPTPGHAMRADDPLPGTVVGKALEPLAAGQGRVRMLVMLR